MSLLGIHDPNTADGGLQGGVLSLNGGPAQDMDSELPEEIGAICARHVGAGVESGFMFAPEAPVVLD